MHQHNHGLSAQSLLGLDLVCTLFFSLIFPRFILKSSLEESRNTFLEISVVLVIASKLILYYSLAPCGDNFLQLINRGLKGLFSGLIVFHTVAVLFGAPLLELFWGTLLWSALVSTLVVCPLSLLSIDPKENVFETCIRVYARKQPETTFEVNVFYQGAGCMLGSWLGAIPIPLDWDRPWQAWPITLIYGAILGYSAGVLCSMILQGFGYKLHTIKRE